MASSDVEDGTLSGGKILHFWVVSTEFSVGQS